MVSKLCKDVEMLRFHSGGRVLVSLIRLDVYKLISEEETAGGLAGQSVCDVPGLAHSQGLFLSYNILVFPLDDITAFAGNCYILPEHLVLFFQFIYFSPLYE
jgi:hypothetical protein